MILDVIQKTYYTAIATARLVRRGARPNWIAIQNEISKLLPRGLSKSSITVPIVGPKTEVKFSDIYTCYDKCVFDTNVLFRSIASLSKAIDEAELDYTHKKAELIRKLLVPSVLKVPGSISAFKDTLNNASTINLSGSTANVDFSAGIATCKTSTNIKWYDAGFFTAIANGISAEGKIDSIFSSYSNSYWKSAGNSEIIVMFESLSEVSAIEIDPIGICDVSISTSTDGTGFATHLTTKLVKSQRLEFGNISCLAVRIRMAGDITGLRQLKIGGYGKESGDYILTNYFNIPTGTFGIPAINSISTEPRSLIQFKGSDSWIPSDWVSQEQISYKEGTTWEGTVSGGYCEVEGFSALTFGPYTKILGGYDAVDVTTGTVLGSTPISTQIQAYPSFDPSQYCAGTYLCGVSTGTVGGVNQKVFRVNPSKLDVGTYSTIEFVLSGSSNLTLSAPSGLVGSAKLYVNGTNVASISNLSEVLAYCPSPCSIKLEVTNEGCSASQYVQLSGLKSSDDMTDVIHAKLQEYSPCNYYSLINSNVPNLSYSYNESRGSLYFPLIKYNQKFRAYYRFHPMENPIEAFRLKFAVEDSLDGFTVIVK